MKKIQALSLGALLVIMGTALAQSFTEFLNVRIYEDLDVQGDLADSTGDLSIADNVVATGTLAWGSGSAITDSDNVALLNAANTFTDNQTLTKADPVLLMRDSSGSASNVVAYLSFGENGNERGYVGFGSDNTVMNVSNSLGQLTLAGNGEIQLDAVLLDFNGNVDVAGNVDVQGDLADSTGDLSIADNVVATGTLAWGSGSAITDSDVVMVEGENVSLMTNDAGYITGVGIASITALSDVAADPGADSLLLWDDSETGTEGTWIQSLPDGFVAATNVTQHEGSINHDALSGFVSDEHIAHSGVTLTAGAGLTGGGTIAASRSFTVGAGTGITVNADDVALSAATIASLALADSAIQSGDNISVFTNDSGYLASVQAGNVDSEAATDGYVLTADGAGNAAWEASAGGALSLFDLADVDADPNADRMAFWDDSDGALEWIDEVPDGFLSSNVALYNANMSSFSSGTLADARLSSNVPLLNAANTFTDNQTLTKADPVLLMRDSSGSASNVVAYLSFGENGNERGYVGFGSDNTVMNVSNSLGQLTLAGNGEIQLDAVLLDFNGNVDVAGNVTATGDGTFNTSDERLKTDIQPVQDAVSKVQQIGGYTYRKAMELGGEYEDTYRAGVIAQEVQAVLPEAILEQDGLLYVSDASLTALLVEAIKEQQVIINSLTSRIETLERSAVH